MSATKVGPHGCKQAERKLIELVRSGEFEIDTNGRVWRAKRKVGLKTGGTHIVSVSRRRAERLLPCGYLQLRAMTNGDVVHGAAHRLVWQHMHGDIPDGLVINHKNGQKTDNHPSNLEVCTPSENSLHAYRTGLSDEHGERHPSAKLTDHDVVAIRLAYASGGYTYYDLADKYGVCFQQISKIVRGRHRTRQGGPTSTNNRPQTMRRRQATDRVATKTRPEAA